MRATSSAPDASLRNAWRLNDLMGGRPHLARQPVARFGSKAFTLNHLEVGEVVAKSG
jgi:hypothetical protein